MALELNLYDLLGIEKNSCNIVIKKAFHSLALKYHPDRTALDKNKATQIFQHIEEAYRLLKDERTRKAYDVGGIESARSMYVELMENPTSAQKPASEQQPPCRSETSSEEEVEVGSEEMPEENRDTFENRRTGDTTSNQFTTENNSTTSMDEGETRKTETSSQQDTTTDSEDEVIIVYERVNCSESEMSIIESSEVTSTGSSESDEESLPSDISIKSCEWLVDSILDEKNEGGTIKYLIKWIGSDENTWEPKENLTGCKLALQKYRRKKRRRMMKKKLKERRDLI